MPRAPRRPAVRSRQERNELVVKNRKLSYHIAYKMHEQLEAVRILGLDEAVSIGFEKLLRAAELFDAKRGLQFSTYACTAIKSGIFREALRASRRASSFTRPEDSEYGDWENLIPDEERPDPLLCQEALETWKKLPKRLRYVVWKRAVEDWTFVDLSKRLKISTQRTRQLYLKAIRWLASQMDGEHPEQLEKGDRDG